MRIGLYGMPTAGKSFILDRIDFLDVYVGSKLLREYDPSFDLQDANGREKDRKDVANLMKKKDKFIMDGHYAFGDEIAFTNDEGEMYDIYIYLYINPSIIKQRMESSDKNQKYLKYNLEEWQMKEIEGLRYYCHKHNKDFYVVDNPPFNTSEDHETTISFIRAIVEGYSCVKYAKECANRIIAASDSDVITLVDGDKTLSKMDTSSLLLDYKTNIFDGNFYTGYQTWKQAKEFAELEEPEFDLNCISYNKTVYDKLSTNTFILSSGNELIWKKISKHLGLTYFGGSQMCAETKLYITKFLQEYEKKVVAFGDSLNDYYMLRKANTGYLITKSDGSFSKSLKGKEMEGITLV